MYTDLTAGVNPFAYKPWIYTKLFTCRTATMSFFVVCNDFDLKV